jgi:pilus assembly protein CpaB
MTKKGPVIILGIGILVALLVSIVSYNFLKSKAQKQFQIQETVDIAIAAIDLPWGTALSSQVLKTAPYLKTSLPVGYHTSTATLDGRVLIYPVKVNEPIFESSLAPTSIKTGGMAAVVSPNKRAMAVKVDKVVGVSGFIFPGNRVDILVTLSGQDVQTAITKTVLENMLVLATGAEVQTTGQQQKPAAVDVITLEVTPEEGEKLGHAATQGKLLLALRNYNDTADILTRGATVPALLASYRGAGEVKPSVGKPRGAAPAPVRQRPFVVEVIQGGKVSSIKFERGE